MSDEARLLVSLEARLNQFEKAFDRAGNVAERGWQRVEKRTKEAGDRMSASMGESVEKMNRTLGLIGLGIGLREVEEMIDAYARLSARVNIAAGSVEKGAAVLERLDVASRQARVSNDDLANSYLQSKDQLDALGYSTETQIEYHQALATALKLSGASADKAATIQDALAKSLADGGIQSKALNKMFVDGGRLAKVFADYLGVPVSQLAVMADQGKLTSNVMVRALKGSLGQLNDELSKHPMQFSEAITALRDALEDYVGKAALAAGIGDSLGASVKFVTENFNSLADGAAAAAAVLLSRYLPGLARIAATTLTNPWIALAAGAAAAAYAIDEYDGKIKLADGSLVTLKDLAGSAWEEIKAGGEIAAQAIEAAYVEAVQFVTKALSGVGVTLNDLEKFTINFAQGVVSSIVFVYDETIAVFKGLPPALAELFINALNSIRATFEDLLNFIVDGLNQVIGLANMAGDRIGAHIPTFDRIDLGRFKNDYAGAGKALGKALGDGLDDALKPRVRQTLDAMRSAASAALDNFQKKAAQHAQIREAGARQSNASAAIDTQDNEKPAVNKQWEADIRKFQQNLVLMRAETAARASATGTINQQDAAIEAFRKEQELLNQAQAAGVEITDQVKEKIHSLGEAYRQVALAAKEVADAQQEARKAAADFENAEKSSFKGFFQDLAKGKSATEALRNALYNLGTKLMDAGLDQIANSLFKNTGSFLAQPNSGTVGSANIAAGVVNVGGSGSIPGVGSVAGGSTLPTPSNPLGGLGALFGLAPAAAPALLKPSAPKSIPQAPAPLQSIAKPAPTQAITDTATKAAETALPNFAASPAFKAATETALPNFASSPAFKSAAEKMAPAIAKQSDFASKFDQSKIFGQSGHGQSLTKVYAPDGTTALVDQQYADRFQGLIGDLHERGYKNFRLDQGGGFVDRNMRGTNKLSEHAKGNALDINPANNPFMTHKTDLPSDISQMAQARGLKWGGDWKTRTDPMHFQVDKNVSNDQIAALQQQQQAERLLQQQTVQANAALKTMPPSLQGVQTGSQGLEGALGQMTTQMAAGAPAANSFSSSLQSLISSLASKPGGGGGLMLGGLFGFAEGGQVSGPGSGTSDSVPAMLSDGEFVVNAKAASRHGRLLAMINDGKVPKFATGGPVTGFYHGGNNSVTNINVTAHGSGNGLADQIAEKVARASKASQPPPDTFRRSDTQRLAMAGIATRQAAQRNG
ncbi:MAG: M15 family metallopeptidase [Proteobacteria bacterium]|nr:M15 family metallopeptidase [Pseudomonadota bacterium]